MKNLTNTLIEYSIKTRGPITDYDRAQIARVDWSVL